MKIVIPILGSSEFLSGVSRHAANMARCLLTRPEVSEVHLVCAEWQYRALCDAVPRSHSKLHFHSISLGRSALSRNFWYYTQFPVLAAQLQADVVHLAYPVPLNRGAFRCPVAMTLHDLYPYDIPENFGRLPHEMELVTFRLVQECLTNIHRHSGSRTASIKVVSEDAQLTVSIQDQGNGMSPARLAEIQSRGSGVGIRGMRERLRQFQGQMHIDSDSSGTRVVVTIPIPKGSGSSESSGIEPLQAANLAPHARWEIIELLPLFALPCR